MEDIIYTITIVFEPSEVTVRDPLIYKSATEPRIVEPGKDNSQFLIKLDRKIIYVNYFEISHIVVEW